VLSEKSFKTLGEGGIYRTAMKDAGLTFSQPEEGFLTKIDSGGKTSKGIKPQSEL